MTTIHVPMTCRKQNYQYLIVMDPARYQVNHESLVYKTARVVPFLRSFVEPPLVLMGDGGGGVVQFSHHQTVVNLGDTSDKNKSVKQGRLKKFDMDITIM